MYGLEPHDGDVSASHLTLRIRLQVLLKLAAGLHICMKSVFGLRIVCLSVPSRHRLSSASSSAAPPRRPCALLGTRLVVSPGFQNHARVLLGHDRDNHPSPYIAFILVYRVLPRTSHLARVGSDRLGGLDWVGLLVDPVELLQRAAAGLHTASVVSFCSHLEATRKDSPKEPPAHRLKRIPEDKHKDVAVSNGSQGDWAGKEVDESYRLGDNVAERNALGTHRCAEGLDSHHCLERGVDKSTGDAK